MQIQLKNIVPAPLAGTFSFHQVWSNDTTFASGKSYLVQAFSGKGKSTLLNIIYGTRRDFEGTLLLDGKDSRDFGLSHWAQLRREKLSMVFQDLRLFPQLTALENLQLKQSLQGSVSMDHLLALAEKMGIAPLLDKKCETLSFGQQQRLAVLRALSQPFDWLLMDEPFSHLDPANVKIICGILEEELSRRKAGLILSTLSEQYPYPFDHTIEI